MSYESFRWLAALIAAHNNQTVQGRLRLQKTVKLLQRIGFPTDYSFSMYHYGPYSEGVQSDLLLLKNVGVIAEKEGRGASNGVRYDISMNSNISLPSIEEFRPAIVRLNAAEPIVLELAATYLAFLEYGLEEDDALDSLKKKKGDKYTDAKFKNALKLLKELKIPGIFEVNEPPPTRRATVARRLPR